MTPLILGLVLFLGMHSVRIVADGARSRFIAQRGQATWKGLHTVVSVIGLALIVWGYSLARQQPIELWPAQRWARHLAIPLTLLAFVLLAAAYVPRNGIKATLHHPMVLGIKAWALAHLLSNNSLADVLLFGGFLVWAAFNFRAARVRDRASNTEYRAGTPVGTSIAVAAGTAAWAAFAFWLHGAWIGVRPMG